MIKSTFLPLKEPTYWIGGSAGPRIENKIVTFLPFPLSLPLIVSPKSYSMPNIIKTRQVFWEVEHSDWQLVWIASPYYCLQLTGHNKVVLRCVGWRTHSRAYDIAWCSSAVSFHRLLGVANGRFPIRFPHQDLCTFLVFTSDLRFYLS
jgi:hypothetical protein